MTQQFHSVNGFIKGKLNDGLTIDIKTNALRIYANCWQFDFFEKERKKNCLQTSKFISGITLRVYTIFIVFNGLCGGGKPEAIPFSNHVMRRFY